MIQVEELLKFLEEKGESFSWEGDSQFQIQGFSSLSNLKENALTWAKSADRFKHLSEKQRKMLLIVRGEKEAGEVCGGGNYIYCSEPKRIFFSLLEQFFVPKPEPRIEPDSVVLSDKIGRGVSIGYGCYIGKEVEIGDGVSIGNHVTIECPTRIGAGSILHSGVVIGTDGFGYYRDGQAYGKVPHFGGVVIGREVEIGANTCIDRGTLDDTQIGDGVKIDNLCHIAHNVQIGKNSLIIACSLLGGSTRIGEGGYVAPGAIVKNQLSVGENSVVGMGAVVTRDIPAGKVAAGVPARVIRENEGAL